MAETDGERIAKLEVMVTSLAGQVSALTVKLEQYTTEMAVARGSFKTFLWFLGAFGSVVALVTTFLTKKFG